MDKKLSKGAYGGVEGSKYVPYVSDSSGIKQTTLMTLVIGGLLAALFAASNAYAGMMAGLTVAAGIPGAILGAGLMTTLAKKSNVLNVNIIQGMSSGGESVASGMIFVLPAVFLIGQEVTFIEGVIAGLAGVVLGIAITSLVYNYLIIEEHGTLVYPEAMAISETLVTSDAGGDGLKYMGIGAAIASVMTLISNSVFGLANTSISYAGEDYKWQWSTDVNPLLIGIGFIVGMEIAVAMFAGAFLANFVIIPLIGYFSAMAADTHTVWNDSSVLINQMDAAIIQGSYTKYIGAGMMLTGGFIGAIKLIPTIIKSVKETFSGISGEGQSEGSSNKFGLILIAVGVVLVLLGSLVFTETIGQAAIGSLLAIVFIFIFAIVASKMTGDIGTSNLPVSGMTIASILIITVTFFVLGWTSDLENKMLLLIGTMVVSGIAISGGYAQSQKVTYIMGGNKDEMQKSFTFAAVIGVIVVTGVIMVLIPQLGSTINPPQAELMATLTKGVLSQELPWAMIFTGAFMSFVLYFLGLPIMTVAIGFYLPMGTVTIILVGALLRLLVEKKFAKDETEQETRVNRGIILSAGLVAGGAIMGLVGSALAVFTTETGSIADASFFVGSSMGDGFLASNGVAFMLLIVLCLLITLPIISGNSNKAE